MAFEAFETKEFTFVNGCFKSESNAVFDVFLYSLFRFISEFNRD